MLVDSQREKPIPVIKPTVSTFLVFPTQQQLSLHLIKSFLFINVLKTKSSLLCTSLSGQRNHWGFFSKGTRWTNHFICSKGWWGFRNTFHPTQSSCPAKSLSKLSKYGLSGAKNITHNFCLMVNSIWSDYFINISLKLCMTFPHKCYQIHNNCKVVFTKKLHRYFMVKLNIVLLPKLPKRSLFYIWITSKRNFLLLRKITKAMLSFVSM